MTLKKKRTASSGLTPPEKASASFLDLVQQHERTWGTQSYPDRPTLADMLSSSVIAWWRSTKPDETRLMATVHEDISELEKHLARLILHTQIELPSRRLAMIHIGQKRASIRAVRLDVQIVEITEE